jgi:HPt (histidine-containing phosphotransfer) domain-containing protein
MENSVALLHELRGCLHRRDYVSMARAAHALKSTSFNTGAKLLGEMCAGLEAFALEAKFEESRNALSDAIQEHARVARALNALRVAA